jgi:superfamily II DNA or RNA helicase
MRVIAAPAGSGKTIHAQIAAVALARLGGTALVVVNQIDKADRVYKELAAVLPGQAAVWTREHNPAQKVTEDKRKLDNGPAAMFTQDELAQYPVAIVTSKMIESVNATRLLRGGQSF